MSSLSSLSAHSRHRSVIRRDLTGETFAEIEVGTRQFRALLAKPTLHGPRQTGLRECVHAALTNAALIHSRDQIATGNSLLPAHKRALRKQAAMTTSCAVRDRTRPTHALRNSSRRSASQKHQHKLSKYRGIAYRKLLWNPSSSSPTERAH